MNKDNYSALKASLESISSLAEREELLNQLLAETAQEQKDSAAIRATKLAALEDTMINAMLDYYMAATGIETYSEQQLKQMRALIKALIDSTETEFSNEKSKTTCKSVPKKFSNEKSKVADLGGTPAPAKKKPSVDYDVLLAEALASFFNEPDGSITPYTSLKDFARKL